MTAEIKLRGAHFARLKDAYASVGNRTWTEGDFLPQNLEISRNLFTPESLLAHQPRPRKLEVYALLSGLPFQPDFTNTLVAVQRKIDAVLGESLHYWVAPTNLGVEYCVFKWPTEAWNEAWRPPIEAALAAIRHPSFHFHIDGVQVNPDGCVVARGYDEDAALFQIREQLKADIHFLPTRQSRWAHVPLGRILEPLGFEKFTQLADLVSTLSNLTIATTEIDTIKFIHEQRWYMEERTTLAEYSLAAIPAGEQS